MKIFKTILHIVLAVLTFIFRDLLVQENVMPLFVGSIMLLYGVEIIPELIKEEEAKEKYQLGLELVLLVIFAAIMMIHGTKNYVTACVVWATWSIYREGSEIFKKVSASKKLWVGVLNAIESLVVIYFSFGLIGMPEPADAIKHIVLLSFELLFAVLFPILDELKVKEEK